MPWKLTLWLVLLTFSGSLLAEQIKHVKHKAWTKKYDRHFKKNTKHYFGPGIDWHFFKAQGIAESGLNPRAQSKRGAKGIMQIMPITYQEILRKQPRFGNIEEPRWNIAAAIYYNRQLYKRWMKKNVPIDERMRFTFASYNAGFNRVLKARKKLREQYKQQPELMNNWQKVSPFIPKETRRYIERIDALMSNAVTQKKT